MSSDNAKSRATPPPRLDWQSELDSAMAEIDTRLTHPRRRASDLERKPVLPELGNVQITSDLLDEIAWRVAQQIRKNGEQATAETVTRALSQPDVATPPVVSRPAMPQPAASSPVGKPPVPPPMSPPAVGRAQDQALQPGKMLMIRYQLPLLPWPLRLLQRRRKKSDAISTARLLA